MKITSVLFGVIFVSLGSVQASQQFDDLAKLIKSGASQDVVIAYVDAADSSYNLTSDQIVLLKQDGASPQEIIAAIEHKGRVSAAPIQTAQPETSAVAPASPTYAEYPGPRRTWRVVRNYWYSPSVEKMKQAVQLDLSGLFLGTLSLNYEYLINHEHGLVVGGSYYPGYSDGDSHGENLELEYRWHWSKSMSSGFVGAFVNGGRIHGGTTGVFEESDTGYAQTSVTVGPDLGRRWVTPWGLSLVGRVGYGYTWSKFDNPAPDRNTQNRLRYLSGFDSEISLGYAF